MTEEKKLVLGPEGFTGIAILGTAGSSMGLAPFNDRSWAIWACSPGAFSICAQNRSDVWFEPHRWMPSAPGKFGAPGTKPWFSPEFHKFLSEHKGPVFMTGAQPSIPSSVPIPYDELKKKYGPYFWTSTISYMLAMAIEELQPRAARGEKVFLGLWGVDMAATEEWGYQRPGCQHFLGLAMAAGIQIVLPAETDLMRPPTMYGIGEHNPRHIRCMAQKAEQEAVIAQISAQLNDLQQKLMFHKGMLAQTTYMLESWTDEVQPNLEHAISFSNEFVNPPLKNEETTGADVLKIADAKS